MSPAKNFVLIRGVCRLLYVLRNATGDSSVDIGFVESNMTISRRRFLELTGSAAATALATQLFGIPELSAENSGAGKPSAELSALAEVALSQARKLGATYVDIRINRYRR